MGLVSFYGFPKSVSFFIELLAPETSVFVLTGYLISAFLAVPTSLDLESTTFLDAAVYFGASLDPAPSGSKTFLFSTFKSPLFFCSKFLELYVVFLALGSSFFVSFVAELFAVIGSFLSYVDSIGREALFYETFSFY